MSSSESPAAAASTLVERVQNFVSENKQAIIIGTAAAAIAVGGVAYYASTSSSRGSTDVEKGEKKDKKKKKKKTVNDADGPILEERKPSKVKVEDEGVLIQSRVWLLVLTLWADDLSKYTQEAVEALPEDVSRFRLKQQSPLT